MERIGPYEIIQELGAGGMGTVYHARHSTTGIEAAVKVLPAALAREPGFVARFNREIEALQKLKSPSIVELYESGVDDGLYFYAMEYVPGETLTARLEREKRIPWREAVELAVQICRALKVAHNVGIIHRDLKPSNLLLAPDGQIKLTDFGVAQVFAGGRLTATGGVIGTAEYMSPEQAQGKRATKQSDIYALGAVLYVMLTGRPPFSGMSALDLAQKHRYGQFDSPRRIVPEIPSWLDEVVCKCLEKSPDDRYPDAYVLSLRLAEIPKKVDLAAAENPSGNEDPTTAGTAAEGKGEAGPMGGTFVRDVVRAELERKSEQSPLQKALDNTWVLAALLAAVIGGGVWLYKNRDPAPETLFERGAELMKQPRGSDWIRARSEYFTPLLKVDRETWEPRVAPYLPQIALAEQELELQRLLRRAGEESQPVASEPDRVFHAVAADLERRDFASAAARLRALHTLLGENPDYALERDIIQNLLSRIPEAAAETDQTLLQQALQRAEQAAADGKRDEAVQIWSSVALLYRNDPAALDAVRTAETRLREHSSP